MTQLEAMDLVEKKISEIQDISDREMIPIRGNTAPIGGVPGFDSLTAIDFTVLIELDVPEIKDIENICLSKDGSRALTVAEIANQIVEATSK